MKKLKRILSKNENRFIDVIQEESGSYSLHQFVRKYDAEEEQSYEIRVLPDPAGKFGELDTAILEAKRILDVIEGKNNLAK
jgi:hypothetical protein